MSTHFAPCGFPAHNDEWDTGDPNLTECHTVSVYGCPNSYDVNNPVPPLTAFVAVNHQPTGTTPAGTIVLLDGDGGKNFLRAGNGTSQYVVDYYNDITHHFTTVQVAWADDWDDNTDPGTNPKSVKDEACRPATLLKYIHDNYAVSSTGAMCAQGHSGGASAISYAMEFYGADKAVSGGYLDTVVMTSGPTLADIYNGCHYAGSGSQAPASSVCHGGVCFGAAQEWSACLEHPMSGHADCFTDSPENYPTGGLYVTARAVAMHTIDLNANCNNWIGSGASTTSADDNAWLDMSLVPVPYGHYPQTFMYGFLCHGRDTVDGEDVSNSSAAQGWSYLNAISPSPTQGTKPAIYRVDGCGDPEMIWKPTSTAVGTQGPQHGYEASRDAMTQHCAVHQ